MIKVVLLGTGNVAGFLFEAFSASENVQVVQVYNHSQKSLDSYSKEVDVSTSMEDLKEADIYLMAVKDDAIPDLAKHLETKKGLVLHTSGAISIDALSGCDRRGVFYPLQTFSKDRKVKNKNISFCLEANGPEDLELLTELAEEIHGSHYKVSSEQRKKLHLAAVFVCNFVNHLYAIGEDICRDNDLPFEILQPLIKETAEKISNSSPHESQTGPAKRNDQTTIQAHLESLKSEENKDIYKLLTQAIQSAHGKKL